LMKDGKKQQYEMELPINPLFNVHEKYKEVILINPYRFGGGNQPEVDTYISGLSTPLSSGQIALLNTFVGSLKTGLSISALSEVFDVMYILAGETAESSLRNLIARNYDATTVNSPTFTALEGYTGENTKYLNSNYNPYTNGIRYTQNSASIGVYSRTNQNNSSSLCGASNAASTYIGNTYIIPRYGDVFYSKINNNTGGDTEVGNSDARGMFVLSRNSSSSFSAYKNKVKSDSSKNTDGLTQYNFFIGARNNAGSATGYYSGQYSFYFVGRGLSETEENTLYDAFQAYMTSNGKQV
jgi:hypothetical protein